MGSSMKALLLADWRKGGWTPKQLADKYGYSLTAVKGVIEPKKTTNITSIVISKRQTRPAKLEPTLLDQYVKELNINGAKQKAKWRAAALKAWETMRYNKAHGITPKKKKKL